MTSNVGAQHIRNENKLGFGVASDDDEARDYRDMRARLTADLRRQFRPEFLNRVDEIIIFHSLTQSQLREVVELMASQLAKRLSDQGIGVVLTTAAKDRILALGWDPNYGARPLRRTIQREIENVIARMLLEEECTVGSLVTVDVKDDEFTFDAEVAPVVNKQDQTEMEEIAAT